MSDDSEIKEMLKTIKNVYQLKMINGDEVICRVENEIQVLDAKPVTVTLKHLLNTKVHFDITWPMQIETISNVADGPYSEKIDYIFKPWMILQSNVDDVITVTSSNVIAIYKPSFTIKAQYFEMVNLYKEFVAAGEHEKPPLSAPKKPSQNVISIFDRDHKDSD